MTARCGRSLARPRPAESGSRGAVQPVRPGAADGRGSPSRPSCGRRQDRSRLQPRGDLRRPTRRLHPARRHGDQRPGAVAPAGTGRGGGQPHLPGPVRIDTFHWDGRQTAYIADGHRVADTALPRPETFQARLLLSAIEVEARQPAPFSSVIVALGDSITEGNGARPTPTGAGPMCSPPGWPGRHRGAQRPGLSGGQLLRAGMGEAGRARFERDVLDVPGVQAVIVALGINDIGWPGSTFLPTTSPARRHRPDRRLPVTDRPARTGAAARDRRHDHAVRGRAGCGRVADPRLRQPGEGRCASR